MTGSIAALNNVVRSVELCMKLQSRDPELPGIGLIYGLAGHGKTTAAQYCLNKFGGAYVRVKSKTTPIGLLNLIAVELGIIKKGDKLKGTYDSKVDQIAEHLVDHPKKFLIFDEAGFLLKDNKIEIVRDIHDQSAVAGCSIILVGEKELYTNLKRWERVDSRILTRMKAEPLSLEDVSKLAAQRIPNIEFADGALKTVVEEVQGSARRAVNLFQELVYQADVNSNSVVDSAAVKSVDLED